MGTWGTGISSNETFTDVYNEFSLLYNGGSEVDAISEKLLKEYADTLTNENDSNNFWFALALAQWECKALDKKVLETVRDLIESGNDLETWKRLGAQPPQLRRRKEALHAFLAKITTHRKRAKARKKNKSSQPVYKKGDCLCFKLDKNLYGGALVLEEARDDEYGHNLIAVTRIRQPQKPTAEDFLSSEVLFVNYANHPARISVHWYNPIYHTKFMHLFEVCGQVDVPKAYNLDNTDFGFISNLKGWVIDTLNDQFAYEASNPPPQRIMPLKELIGKYWLSIS